MTLSLDMRGKISNPSQSVQCSVEGLIAHLRILALLDRMHDPNDLLSQAQVLNISPGETGQALHFDDAFGPVARPRAPFGAATVWAIDHFAEDNGATVVVPKSQSWGDDWTPTEQDDPNSRGLPSRLNMLKSQAPRASRTNRLNWETISSKTIKGRTSPLL